MNDDHTLPPITQSQKTASINHSWLEDGVAILMGSFLFSIGLSLIQASGLITGGTPGIALLISHITHISFGITMVLVNIPFFYLAVRRKGWEFTMKTCVAIGLLSYFSSIQASFLQLKSLEPLYGAVAGSCLLAVSFVVLFRHKASLGGVNVLALYLQDKWGIRAGYFQLALDLIVMLLTFFVVSPHTVAYSVIGVIIVNVLIAMNHRFDRYIA